MPATSASAGLECVAPSSAWFQMTWQLAALTASAWFVVVAPGQYDPVPKTAPIVLVPPMRPTAGDDSTTWSGS